MKVSKATSLLGSDRAREQQLGSCPTIPVITLRLLVQSRTVEKQKQIPGRWEVFMYCKKCWDYLSIMLCCTIWHSCTRAIVFLIFLSKYKYKCTLQVDIAYFGLCNYQFCAVFLYDMQCKNYKLVIMHKAMVNKLSCMSLNSSKGLSFRNLF